MRAVCRRFGKTTVSYYDELKRRGRQALDEEKVVALVNEVRIEMPFLGVRKVYFLCRKKFAGSGVRIGRDRLFDLLRRKGMLIERRRHFVPKTTKCDTSLPISLNLTKGLVVDGPNQVHVADITYIRVGDGFAYLSLVTDRFCRDIVGWCLSDDLTSSGPMAAMRMAAKGVPPGTPVIEHSDRGCQYASKAYRRLLSTLGFRSSMTEDRHCYENGAAERVNGILKAEFGLDARFESMKAARVAVREAIRNYNTKRPHEMLGCLTPAQARQNPELARPAAMKAFEAARQTSERRAAKRKAAEKAGRNAA